MNGPGQSLRVVSVLGAFLCGLAVVLAAILFLAGRSSSVGPAIAAVGGPFQLVDQDGKTVSDADMKGRPFLVFFGYTHCPDVCPTTLFEMSQMLHALGPDAGRIGALFITVDPERDTPAVLKDYLASFDPHLRGLTGGPAAVDAALKAYRVYAKKVPLKDGDYTMDHTALIYLMDRDGKFVAPFNLKRTPEEAAADLKRYL